MKTKKIRGLSIETIFTQVEAILNELDMMQDSSHQDIFSYNIKLALWELFSNLISHGGEEVCEEITVHIYENEAEILFKVISDGNRFNWKEYKENDCPSFEQEGGRGLYILQQICDRFAYEEEGQMAILGFEKQKEAHK
ncbi:ATP-binding protein [Cytobacillus spongiae]|jgi:anti-sigma regulatory factor (Ser/Thr protein kinase)|uniref:ATP-binding protein n=1 Tax=Cytobacillus spongiae TaxID=2901381 RepID=UPI001F175D15|nr:ATP-binding protein [Cytobacillus spongiae]UII56205.1 ATP-binding protein [Cytobacillus spongiae]